jgi:hypothetical protein
MICKTSVDLQTFDMTRESIQVFTNTLEFLSKNCFSSSKIFCSHCFFHNHPTCLKLRLKPQPNFNIKYYQLF